MSYLIFQSQVPSLKLCKAYLGEATKGMRAVESTMNNLDAYEGLTFDETKDVHNVLFRAFRRHLHDYQHFSRLLCEV